MSAGWIKKRGDSYRARWRNPDGSMPSRTFRTRREAQDFIDQLTADIARGEYVDPRRGRIRYDDWIAEWFATTVHLRESTRARDRSYLNTHILPVFGHLQLAQIRQPHVKRWVADLTANPKLAPATVVKVYQVFGKTMRAAVSAELIVKAPLNDIKLPEVITEIMRFLEPEEMHLLAGTIDPRYRALVYLGAVGGLRIGEMAALQWRHVDVDAGHAQVLETAIDVGGRLTFGPPKTRAARRVVPLPPEVMTTLEQHRAFFPTDLRVFAGPKGGPMRVTNWRKRVWHPAVAAAGLAPLRPHDLRHTAISFWIAQGADPKWIAERAGHTSVRVVLDRYGHVFPRRDRELTAGLSSLFVR